MRFGRRYEVFYDVIRSDGSMYFDSVIFDCDSCLSALSEFDLYVSADDCGIFKGDKTEVYIVRRV